MNPSGSIEPHAGVRRDADHGTLVRLPIRDQDGSIVLLPSVVDLISDGNKTAVAGNDVFPDFACGLAAAKPGNPDKTPALDPDVLDNAESLVGIMVEQQRQAVPGPFKTNRLRFVQKNFWTGSATSSGSAMPGTGRRRWFSRPTISHRAN